MIRATLVVLVLFYSNQVFSCGTVEMAINGIYGKGPMARYHKHELFEGLANGRGQCRDWVNNKPVLNQERLLSLLTDNRFYKYTMIYGKAVFISFDCLKTQKDKKEYKALVSRYGDGLCK